MQAKLGLNKFFDLTVDEFTGMYTGTLPEVDDQQDVAGSLASGSTSRQWRQLPVHRHFKSQLDPYMRSALAEIASGRRLFVDTYDRKTKETKVGIMQVAPEVAQWLGRELGYKSYDIEDNTNFLYWPLVNVYFGAAYAKWLFSCDDKQRTEEFVVRAYKGGKKKAAHKSTSPIFQRYLYVKENLLSMRQPEICHELTPDLENLSSAVDILGFQGIRS
ncbi:uncharacterized protein [Miscanthus floridulus]|uniref:uncharacterized protein isoform X4 n=1 Tax=Miscanthus floridulus TaxID=154761 RepID=UPI00345ACCF0